MLPKIASVFELFPTLLALEKIKIYSHLIWMIVSHVLISVLILGGLEVTMQAFEILLFNVCFLVRFQLLKMLEFLATFCTRVFHSNFFAVLEVQVQRGSAQELFLTKLARDG